MADISEYTSNLNREEVKLLLRRIQFGVSKSEIDANIGKTPSQIVAQALTPISEMPDPPIDPKTGDTWLNPKQTDANSEGRDLMGYFLGWWLERMRTSSLNITEKMVHFYHTHFTCKSEKVNVTPIYYQNALFRQYALGNFKELAYKICFDNAMIEFLDSQLNDNGRPNENFAREFLELYTIGKGPQVSAEDYTNYTETDIQEAARVLSGINIDKTFTNIDEDTGLPMGVIKTSSDIIPQLGTGPASRHDPDPKEFNGSLGGGGTTIQPTAMFNNKATIDATYQEIADFNDMIFEREETARHICRKIYRYFSYYQITDEVENDIIGPLSQTFIANDFNVAPVLNQLLISKHFYDVDTTATNDDHKGALIKSPVELLVGTFKFLELDIDALSGNLNLFYHELYRSNVIPHLTKMGIKLYDPPEVAGYPAYHQTPEYNRNWITANNLGQRYALIDELVEGYKDEDDNIVLNFDVMDFIENSGHFPDPTDVNEVVGTLINYLFPREVSEDRFNYFRDTVLLDNLSITNWFNEWQNYQSTGDDTAVRTQLGALVKEIIQSPEYQLF